MVEKKPNYFIVRGGGHGHGSGMSQYGAKYLASKGKSFEEILMHFYKDTEISYLYRWKKKELLKKSFLSSSLLFLFVVFYQRAGSCTDFRVRQNHVEFCTEKKDIHAEIEPEHADCKSGQATINVGKVSYSINVKREQVGETKPAGSG